MGAERRLRIGWEKEREEEKKEGGKKRGKKKTDPAIILSSICVASMKGMPGTRGREEEEKEKKKLISQIRCPHEFRKNGEK